MRFLSPLILGLVLAHGALCQDSPNAFPEGDFENGLEGWKFPHPNYLKTLGASIGAASDGEQQFLRFSQTNSAADLHAAFEIPLPEAAASVQIKYRIRGEGIQASSDPSWAGGFMGGGFVDSADQMVKDIVPKQRVKSDTAGWLEVEDTFPVPAGATKLRLQPGLYRTSGQLDLDQVEVYFH